VIIGDWMSEANMTALTSRSLAGETSYEPTFLEALAPALSDIAKYGIKVAVNAGASDVKGLAAAVRKMIEGNRMQMKVAWIEGDDVLSVVREKLGRSRWQGISNERMKGGKGMSIRDAWMEGEDVGQAVRDYISSSKFENLCTGESLKDWAFKNDIIGAQAYLGGLGIARAFQEGADIVVAGRVSDASPVIGAAVWWHGWHRSQLDELAKAFVAGHLIECSTYVCGGNFTGFKDFEGMKSWTDIGYPIAEIGNKGEVVITKQTGTGGVVSEETCKAQLLYEIQGPWYFNSDVTAILDQISFEQLGTNRVALHGVNAGPPPPTTKIGITARGGFQAEAHWFLVGLDIEAKARMLEMQIRRALGNTSRFNVLKFTINGTAAENPTEQNAVTVDFRVFAQAREEKDLATNRFLRPIIDLIMCSYPGATFHLDFRQGLPKAVHEYFVALLPQGDIRHLVHLHDGRKLAIDPPIVTKMYPRQQPSQAVTSVSVHDFGETIRGPLGWLVHARSGDKGSNANVGFWVRHADEYDWLRILLSTENLKTLLAKEHNGKRIVSCHSVTRFALLMAIGSIRATENLGRALPPS
jgi:hypothetical protein